jgi:cytochrome c oxidase assembly protein Cox11
MCIGVPHFSSVFFACLYQKYLSENIEQLLEVFFGIDEQLSKNKKIDKDKKNLKRITLHL